MSQRAAPATVWIVTGMSGAGKATALRALERAGAGCVDNLPPALLPDLVSAATGPTVAVVDARQARSLAGFVPPAGVRVLFLDARDEVLVHRLAESLRPHPCAAAGGGRAAISAERAVLEPMRAAAEAVLDTSDLAAAELGERVVALVGPGAGADDRLVCTVSSFGFKWGAQGEADWVVDARFLRNPFWEPALRPLTGLDRPVRDYVLDQPAASEFLDRLEGLVGWCAARAEEHGRRRLHVAVGCTGGRHRSVALAAALAGRLEAAGIAVQLRHRDLHRPAEPSASR